MTPSDRAFTSPDSGGREYWSPPSSAEPSVTHPDRVLSIGQRFQLGILCEEYDQAVAVARPGPPANEPERAAVVTATARLARHLAGHGLRWDQFTAAGREDYRPAFHAAVLLRRRDYEAGTLGHDTLAAADGPGE
jgi:hypothetical protein